MIILRLKIDFAATGPAKLPAFKGSALRGSFGQAMLRQMQTQSGNDLLKCAFKDFFLGDRQQDDTRFKSSKVPPHPFAFFSADQREMLNKDEKLSFEFSLFGKSVTHFPVLIDAFKEMARFGLGVDRYQFELLQISILKPDGHQEMIYHDNRLYPGKLNGASCHVLLPPEPNKHNKSDGTQKIKIEFLSPVKWSQNVEKNTQFAPDHFLKAVLRKASLLSYFWENDEWKDFDFGSFIDMGRNISINNYELTWNNFSRFSSTQEKKVPLTGFTGNLSLAEVPSVVADFLRQAQIMPIGKGAVFGLGRFAII